MQATTSSHPILSLQPTNPTNLLQLLQLLNVGPFVFSSNLSAAEAYQISSPSFLATADLRFLFPYQPMMTHSLSLPTISAKIGN
jgi:hypothetical protein